MKGGIRPCICCGSVQVERSQNAVLNFNDVSVTVQMIVAHFIHATSLNCIMYLCLQLCIS